MSNGPLLILGIFPLSAKYLKLLKLEPWNLMNRRSDE